MDYRVTLTIEIPLDGGPSVITHCETTPSVPPADILAALGGNGAKPKLWRLPQVGDKVKIDSPNTVTHLETGRIVKIDWGKQWPILVHLERLNKDELCSPACLTQIP